MGHAAATDMATRIQQLRKGQSKLREERQKIGKELKAALRKSERLKERARQLSEDDMMQILVMKRAKHAANAAQRTALSNDLSSASGSGFVSAARIDDLDLPGPSGDRTPSPEDDEDGGPE
jgi:predicted phage gp36 major capsid-like protein